MRALLATLLLVLMIVPAPAQDRYAGYYNADCGNLVCDLRIKTAGADRWSIVWEAIDPRDASLTPVCRLETSVAIGEATVGDMVVDGIAVGQIGGKPFGIIDLEPGRVSWSSEWEACPGLAPDGIYEAVGD